MHYPATAFVTVNPGVGLVLFLLGLNKEVWKSVQMSAVPVAEKSGCIIDGLNLFMREK